MMMRLATWLLPSMRTMAFQVRNMLYISTDVGTACECQVQPCSIIGRALAVA